MTEKMVRLVVEGLTLDGSFRDCFMRSSGNVDNDV